MRIEEKNRRVSKRDVTTEAAKGRGSLRPMTAKNWILPTTQGSKGIGSPLEPQKGTQSTHTLSLPQ